MAELVGHDPIPRHASFARSKASGRGVRGASRGASAVVGAAKSANACVKIAPRISWNFTPTAELFLDKLRAPRIGAPLTNLTARHALGKEPHEPDD